jgi:hypothetical protein
MKALFVSFWSPAQRCCAHNQQLGRVPVFCDFYSDFLRAPHVEAVINYRKARQAVEQVFQVLAQDRSPGGTVESVLRRPRCVKSYQIYALSMPDALSNAPSRRGTWPSA